MKTVTAQSTRPTSRVTVEFGPGWWLLPSVIGGGYIWYRMIAALLG